MESESLTTVELHKEVKGESGFISGKKWKKRGTEGIHFQRAGREEDKKLSLIKMLSFL